MERDAEIRDKAAHGAAEVLPFTNIALPGAIWRGFLFGCHMFMACALAGLLRTTFACAAEQAPKPVDILQSIELARQDAGWSKDGDYFVCRDTKGKKVLGFPEYMGPDWEKPPPPKDHETIRAIPMDGGRRIVVLHFREAGIGKKPDNKTPAEAFETESRFRFYDERCQMVAERRYPKMEPSCHAVASNGSRLVLTLFPHESRHDESFNYVGPFLVFSSSGGVIFKLDNVDFPISDCNFNLVGPENRFGYLRARNRPGPRPEYAGDSYAFFDSWTGSHHIYRIDQKEHPAGVVHISTTGRIVVQWTDYVAEDGTIWDRWQRELGLSKFKEKYPSWREVKRIVYEHQFPQ